MAVIEGDGPTTMVAMELDMFSGLIALGLCTARRYRDPFTSLTAMLRIFVGIRLLHEISPAPAPA